MLSRTRRPKKWLPLWLIGSLLGAQIGCSSNEGVDRNGLTWRDAEAALKSGDVRTIKDYYSRLSEEATSDFERTYYSDPKSLEEFITLDEYFNEFNIEYSRPGVTPEVAKSMLANELTWKSSDNMTVNGVTRSYCRIFEHRTHAHYLADWGNLIYVRVFTNDEGVIVGWMIIR